MAIWAWIAVGTVVTFVALSWLLRRTGGHAPGWRVRCVKCGQHWPAANMGIIRLGGRGAKYTLGKCAACGRVRWVALERDPETTR